MNSTLNLKKRFLGTSKNCDFSGTTNFYTAYTCMYTCPLLLHITYKYAYLISTVMNPTNTVFWSYAVKGSFNHWQGIINCL